MLLSRLSGPATVAPHAQGSFGVSVPQTRHSTLLRQRHTPLLLPVTSYDPRAASAGNTGPDQVPADPPHTFPLRTEPGLPDTSDAGLPDTSGAAALPPPKEQKKPLLQRFKEFLTGSSGDRAKLASLGMGAFAAYSVISNLNYGVALTIAWLGFVKLYGVTPLAPGQWGPFLAYYAGIWTVQNFARPLRLAGAVAAAPFFNRLLASITVRTGLAPGVAFGAVLAVIAATTCTLLGTALVLLGGFPPAAARA